jgi:hypothetical protein
LPKSWGRCRNVKTHQALHSCKHVAMNKRIDTTLFRLLLSTLEYL